MAYVEGDDAAAGLEINGSQASRRSTSASDCRQPIRMLLAPSRSSNLYRRPRDSAAPGLRNAAAEFEEADAPCRRAVKVICQTVRQLGRFCVALAMWRRCGPGGRVAGKTSKLFPNGTLWNAVQLPAMRAAIALKRDQPAKAVETADICLAVRARLPRGGVTCGGWLTWVCMKALGSG